MAETNQQVAPSGDLSTFEREHFASHGFGHDLYRKGSGPAVIVMPELPGVSPQVLGFADRVAALGCTVCVPDMFGTAGRDPLAGSQASKLWYFGSTTLRACVSREFSAFALGRSAPAVHWLRALAAHEHARCGGPGVGVVGMCFTGGFALAMATDPLVLAPVLSQPSLPFGVNAANRGSIDCSDDELERVATRCAGEGLRVLGLRFKGDPAVPGARFRFLKERLGDGFVAVELPQESGHPAGPLPKHHSVLTTDLIDEPGQPTRAALDQVLELFREKLLSGAAPA